MAAKKYKGNDLVFGATTAGKQVVWSEEMRRTHAYITGVTRSGKSRFLRSMVQQDIEAHAKTRMGLLVLDPHGELYDGILAYVAARPRLWRRPIMLIDLRRDDWVVSYNMLRARPGLDPAVIATGFVEAITHAFGGGNVTDTPRLARIARIFIQALLDAKRSLVDVLPLLDFGNSALRDTLLADLPESGARDFFAQFNQLGKRDFDSTVESFLNRLSSFLTNRLISHMVGQSGTPSFDFGRAIEDGAIVLMSLATAHGKVAETDSRLFASLMLSDLWQAAKLRDKKGAGLVKPFAVYADEFQNFLTPTIAYQLDQASGFGLQFILAHQFPGQILDHGGDYGRAIFNSVMVNARTKVAFQAAEQRDQREPLVAALFDGAVDVHRPEPAITSFQTVGHREVHRILRGGGESDAEGVAQGTTTTRSTTRAAAIGRGKSRGQGFATTDSASTAHAYSAGHSSMASFSEMHGTSTAMQGDTGMPVSTATVNTTAAFGESHADGDAYSESDGDTESHAESVSTFDAESSSVVRQRSTAESSAQTTTVNSTHTESKTWHEQITLEPILAERPSGLMSVDAQLFEFGQRLSAQPQQHAHVRLPGERLPESFRALDCPDEAIASRATERIRLAVISRMDCAMPFSAAAEALSDARAQHRGADIDAVLRIAATGKRRGRGTLKENGHE